MSKYLTIAPFKIFKKNQRIDLSSHFLMAPFLLKPAVLQKNNLPQEKP